MDHGAHVRLVDAHPERVRRHHHRRLAGHERALRLGARFALHPGVVGRHGPPELRAQPLRGRLRLLAGAGVDDRRQRIGLGQQRQRRRLLGALGADLDDVVGEVRAVEAGRDPHRVAQPEPLRDVDGDPRRRGRRRGEDRARPERAGDVAEPQVVGPEVVAPLAHAVRLVDDEDPDRRLAQPVDESRRREPLRRDVEHRDLTRDRARERPAVVGLVALCVDQLGPPAEALDLVGHQRDERRDDDGQLAVEDRRQLVAERLAGAGGHHQQDVAASDHRLDGLELAGAKGGVAEVALQRLGELSLVHPWTTGSASSANFPFASPPSPSGYSPVKQASQWTSRGVPTAS